MITPPLTTSLHLLKATLNVQNLTNTTEPDERYHT